MRSSPTSPSATAITRRIQVILNDRSGTTAKDRIAEQVVEFLGSRGHHVDVEIAQTGTQLVSAAARAASGPADLVVAGGGDGTLGTVAGHLVAGRKLFGVLPLGTFNYFARRLDIPLELNGALELIATGVPRTVDVGEVNGHLFLNNASIGLYPAVLRQRETTYRRLGRSRAVAYASVALVLVQPPALMNLHLDADGVRLARRTPLLFVGANEHQMESFGIPAQACIRRGRLASYITRPLGLLPLWRLALRAFFRGLYGAAELEVVCAHELRVSLRPRTVRVAVDGEVVTLDTPLQFRMRPDALAVVAGGPPDDLQGTW